MLATTSCSLLVRAYLAIVLSELCPRQARGAEEGGRGIGYLGDNSGIIYGYRSFYAQLLSALHLANSSSSSRKLSIIHNHHQQATSEQYGAIIKGGYNPKEEEASYMRQMQVSQRKGMYL